MLNIKLGSLIFFTPQLADSVAFYQLLGLPLDQETHEETGAEHYAADVNGVHIAFYEATSGEAPRWRVGGCTWPGFVVADLSTTLAQLRARGINVLSEPEERPWGTRVVVEDPDGRPIELWENAEAATQSVQ